MRPVNSVAGPANLPDLSEYVIREEEEPVGEGAYSQVYGCSIRVPSGEKVKVAVKVLKPHSGTNTLDIDKDLRRELGIWKRLQDRNVVPLLGTVMSFEGTLPSMVSAWMPLGTLETYLSQKLHLLIVPDRLRMLEGIASGLQYLHFYDMVHGDLTCRNILIDETGNPRLADFGLSSLVGPTREGLSYLHLSAARPGALRWTAAEFFSATPVPTTKKSDVYSLGSLILYVLSGEEPWAKMRDGQVIFDLCRRRNPPRPQSPVISPQRWSFIEDCWSPGSPDKRPTTTKVLSFIRSELGIKGPKKIVLFGESGVGKSSVVNLIAGENIATVSDGVATCTSRTEMHNITVDSSDLVIFDTVGLGSTNYLEAIEEAYALMRSLQADGDVDLLILCIRAGLSWRSLEHQYRLCHEFLCQEQVPVAIVVTGLEHEHRMERWWDDHSAWMDGHGVKVAAHACVTATPGYGNTLIARYEESKRSVRELIRTCIRGYDRPRTRNILGWFGAPRSTRGQIQQLTGRCGLDEEGAEQLVRRIQRSGVSERRT